MDAQAVRERIMTSTPKDHASPALKLDKHERKTLQTLQFSATDNKLNGGKDRVIQQKGSTEGKQKSTDQDAFLLVKTSHPSPQVVKIYADRSLSENDLVARCSRFTQTEDILLEDLLHEKFQHLDDTEDSGRETGYIEQEAYDLMVKEEVSETYWKDVAEERRRALKETMAENELLHLKLEHLTEENRRLKEENTCMTDIVIQAEAMKEILEGALSEDDDQDRDGSRDFQN